MSARNDTPQRKAYLTQMLRVTNALTKIGSIVRQHARAGDSWGHVGDLAEVAARLEEIIQFLGGDVEQPQERRRQ